ncbi:MAG: alpha/beta hydrolase-fold protein [Planctomycetota bacterium]
MKIAVIVLIVAALLGFGGLYLWEQSQVADATAEADAFAETAEARELVEVVFVVESPEGTPADQSLYISGDHNKLGSWEAAGLPLERAEDGTYRGSTELLTGIEREFKVTRGSWSTVETTADEEEVDNRIFVAEPGKEIKVAVERWIDNGETIPNRITTTGDIRLHERRFASVVDETKPRSLVVYLPPGYGDAENADTTYPVVYVHDGQNLFNEATTYAGIEWSLDETAEAMISTGQIKPVILVGVYNTENRDDEYGPRIADYAAHLVETIKPFVEQTYRVQTNREANTIMGAGLGGRAALEAARLHPDAFGAVVALSPWIVSEDGDNVTDAWVSAGAKAAAWATDTRFMLDTVDDPAHYGTETPAADLKLATDWLEAHDADVTHATLPAGQGEHREASWGDRAGEALRWLFGNRNAETTALRVDP